MRNLLVAFSILALTIPANLSAQERPPKPKVVSPAPKRPLMQRIFGGGLETPAPAPVATPVASPKPATTTKTTPRTKKTRTRTPAAETQPPAPKKEETRNEVKTEPPAPANEAPATATDAPEPTAETKPATKKTAKESAKKTAPPKPNTEGMDDATKFQTVKAAAQEDPAIQALKEKADSALSDSEAHAASLAYNRALFRKIRELEPSLGEYVAAMEGAMMKLLTAEKKAQ